MNKEWSEKNKKMQSLIGKKDSFAGRREKAWIP